MYVVRHSSLYEFLLLNPVTAPSLLSSVFMSSGIGEDEAVYDSLVTNQLNQLNETSHEDMC